MGEEVTLTFQNLVALGRAREDFNRIVGFTGSLNLRHKSMKILVAFIVHGHEEITKQEG